MDALDGRRAVCLFSGGLDSTTSLYVARREGYEVFALTVDYGQIHLREIESAKKIARHLGVEHQIITASLPWGSSALTDPHIPIAEGRSPVEMQKEIPSTYVPARNTVLLSLAASFAEARNAEAIFIGANAIDYSGYPDCRLEYLMHFEALLKLGTKRGVEGKPLEIKAPLISLRKSEIVKLGQTLGVPFEWTWSCYKGGDIPCGTCDSCLLRAEGFKGAGAADPAMAGAHK